MTAWWGSAEAQPPPETDLEAAPNRFLALFDNGKLRR
jgi:hypothetical protein